MTKVFYANMGQRFLLKICCVVGALLLMVTTAAAQSALFPPKPLAPLSMSARGGTNVFTSDHTGVFNGKRISYQALVEETVIINSTGTPVASLYTTAYVAKGIKDAAKRPVLFIFNGGPGGSSAPMHLTSMGPKILNTVSADAMGDPNVKLVDNPQALLDVTDLVFIDPVDTGFSRTLPGEVASPFRSIDGDSDSITQLITHWLTTHGRMASPKYVMGESYGSLRAVALARDLARATPKTPIDGVILVGQAITFGQNVRLPDPVRLAYRLPMMASVAWYHGKIDNKSQTWEQAVEKARVFARTDYLAALVQGYRLRAEERDRIIAKLPDLIGIPESYFRENDTISVQDFNATLLKAEGQVLDGNNGMETRPASAPAPSDDYLAAFRGLLTTMERYTANDLKVKGLGPYLIFTPNIMQVFYQWDFATTGARALDATLAEEMKKNAKLRVLVLQGRYDTLTQIGSTEYTMSQTDLPLDRYSYALFDGGHLLLATPESTAALRALIAGMP